MSTMSTMSSTTNTETKEDSITPPKESITKPKTTKKKKKKKKNTILYQETAVKYFDGFMKNKRYNKGINLSTGCAIFKTAWELPENNGLILPSRVMRHFKQVLPKKPKQNKKKKKKTNNNKSNNNNIKTNTTNNTETINDNEEEGELMRSRTMVDIKGINELNLNSLPNHNYTQQFRRTMFATTVNFNSKQLKTDKTFDDNIEHIIHHSIQEDDNNILIPNEQHIKSKSINNLMGNINTSPINAHAKLSQLHFSDTPITPDPEVVALDKYVDHAHITMDDMIPDVEETPMLENRAETDIHNMHHDLVSFIIKKEEKKDKEDIKEEIKEEKENNNKTTKKKKKKKKNVILYSEDATRLFKKISDGKRLKNGITLKKACNIFSVAWELPEENGRILPSKVARHFKQVLPSKKNKINNKNKKNKNIKPSVAKSRTHRDKIVISNSNEEEKNNNNNLNITKPRSNTMRGHLNVMNGHNIVRSSNQLPSVAYIMNNNYKPKKSIIADLESLISSDPNRIKSNNNNDGRIKIQRKKAGSLTDLELNNLINNNNDENHEEEEDQIVENEIDQLIKEKKN